jgi:hypothetical protein
MTLAEVEELLGGPAADTSEMPPDCPAFRCQREWREGSEVVVVQFFADGRVMAAQGRGRQQPGHVSCGARPATAQPVSEGADSRRTS